MQMTVRPLVAATAASPDSNPASTTLPAPKGPSSAPRSWIGKALSSFIDIVEPAATLLAGRRRLIAVISADGHDMTFHLVSGRRVTLLGDSTGDRSALMRALKRSKIRGVELRLDPDHLATTRFKIPAAGSEFARQIIESRLDRLTPWRPEAVIHGFALSGKPGADGQLDVDFLATSREIVTGSIDRVLEYGLSASALGSAEQPLTDRLRVDLLAGGKDKARNTRRRMIGGASIAVVLVSAIICGNSVYTGVQSTDRLAELDATLAKARNRLVQASGSSAERDKDFAYINTKRPTEARFFLINRLAVILPDNTYLDELDIDPTSARIAGTSADAASLISLLEADAAFNDVKFSAPVTRQDDGRDRFEITALHGAKSADAKP